MEDQPSGLVPALARTRGPSVLLVDDNPVNLMMLGRMLEHLGARVRLAPGGREALALLEQEPASLIFMDCDMPEVDGFETTRALRERELTGSRAVVIALSGHASLAARDAARASGMDDYLAKPVRLEQLRAALEQWTGGGRTGPAAGDPAEPPA